MFRCVFRGLFLIVRFSYFVVFVILRMFVFSGFVGILCSYFSVFMFMVCMCFNLCIIICVLLYCLLCGGTRINQYGECLQSDIKDTWPPHYIGFIVKSSDI